jgi:hypothetical protein
MCDRQLRFLFILKRKRGRLLQGEYILKVKGRFKFKGKGGIKGPRVIFVLVEKGKSE